MTVRASVLLVALVCTASGCVKYEKFAFRDAGDTNGDGGDGGDGSTPGSGARATVTGTHVAAEVPGLYVMDFGDDGYRFPDQLTIGTTQLLSPVTPSCASELGTGVSFYPAGIFTSVDQNELSATTQDITVEIPGPGIARVQLDWAAAFAKQGCVGSPSGRTTFTFFPDGRIQRMDLARIDMSVMASTCGCTSDSQWENAAYISFLESMVNDLTGVTRPTSDGTSELTTETMCFRNATGAQPYQIAIDFRTTMFRRMRKVGANLAVMGDMISQGLDPLTAAGDASTVMLIAADSDCTALATRMTPYREDRQLEIDGTNEGIGMDGLYGGAHDGAPDRRGVYIPGTSGTTITLRAGPTGDVPPFGIRLDLEDFAGIASVERDWASTVTDWYTLQEVRTSAGDATGMWVLWFAEGLTGARTITIEAIAK